jgi:hypothetical protein
MTQTTGNFPKRVEDLPGLVLEVECLTPACAGRLVRMYPIGTKPDPKLTMAEVLARCRCTQCRVRPDYLILSLEGRNEKGHENRLTPQWLFGKDEVWVEIPNKRIDADWFWENNKLLKHGRRRGLTG